MAEPICYLNGKYMPVSRARIPAIDRGFLFGEGLFETWRMYRGRPYGLREHLQRMARTARSIGIPFQADTGVFARVTAELARRNRMIDSDGAVRLTITRGSGPVALVVSETVEPTTLVLFRPLEPGLDELQQRGGAVHLCAAGSGVCEGARQMKTLNYLPAVLARTEARKRNCFEALYVLGDGTVLEGTTSNVFVVRRGVVRTTPVAAGVLAGVTRAKILAIARRIARDVREQVLTVDALENADEVFVTASTIEVVPIVRIGRRKVAGGAPGPITLGIQREYRRRVERALGLPST